VTNRSIVVELPEDLYDRLRRQAEQAQRTVEQQVLQVVATALSSDDSLPPDVQATYDQLPFLSDEELWQAARMRLSSRSLARMASYNRRRGRGERLSDAQAADQQRLLHEYDRVVLLRAHAAALLKERGHDVSVLLSPP
jgi:hypothetical protein